MYPTIAGLRNFVSVFSEFFPCFVFNACISPYLFGEVFPGEKDSEQEHKPGCGIDDGAQQQEYGSVGDGIEQDADCRAANSDGDIADQAEEAELVFPSGTSRRYPANAMDQHTDPGNFSSSLTSDAGHIRGYRAGHGSGPGVRERPFQHARRNVPE